MILLKNCNFKISLKILILMEKLKIAALNLDIEWKNKPANFLLAEKEFENTEADLFLLPEMFSTGFSMEPDEIADRNLESLSWMQKLAETKKAAVAGSVSVAENGRFYNRFYFVYPDHSFDFYDKRHLFSYSGEHKVYEAGTTRKVIEYKGFRMLLQVCYDLRFPVFARNNDDYDAILYVANWPKTRVEAWKHLLKARAIENQAYVFGLNRIGVDGNQLEYEESSRCFFADGSEIEKHEGHLVFAEFDQNELTQFRAKFGFLADRDNFELLI